MLVMCPEKRISARDALKHPYLATLDPLPCKPRELPRMESEISQNFVSEQQQKTLN